MKWGGNKQAPAPGASVPAPAPAQSDSSPKMAAAAAPAPAKSSQPQSQATSAHTAHSEELAAAKLAIEELTRENNMLATRVAEFFAPSSSGHHGDNDDEPVGVTLTSPPALLMARIKRLEMALQLEAIAREELETRCAAQDKLLIALIEQLEGLGVAPANPFATQSVARGQR